MCVYHKCVYYLGTIMNGLIPLLQLEIAGGQVQIAAELDVVELLLLRRANIPHLVELRQRLW